MKQRVKLEDGIELSTICRQLKLLAPDGKMRLTDCANVQSGGKYSASTIYDRFGSWNNVLEKIGLNFVQKNNASDEELFLNLDYMNQNKWVAANE